MSHNTQTFVNNLNTHVLKREAQRSGKTKKKKKVKPSGCHSAPSQNS
jgi:hypothetical protein